MDEPALLVLDSVDRLAIHEDAVLKSQQHPQPSISERGMLLDQLAEPFRPRRVGPAAVPPHGSWPMQAGPAEMALFSKRSRYSSMLEAPEITVT